jgi:asparagine synthase (glutamine-hydrolysing)
MCGIAAIFAYSDDAPNVDRDELLAIRDQMIARGPGGAGEWFRPDNRVALGHRRLSIIDLSPSGAQPMLLPERQLAIVFNGEIYNYRELRNSLETQGRVFKSTRDTEVMLGLALRRGVPWRMTSAACTPPPHGMAPSTVSLGPSPPTASSLSTPPRIEFRIPGRSR